MSRFRGSLLTEDLGVCPTLPVARRKGRCDDPQDRKHGKTRGVVDGLHEKVFWGYSDVDGLRSFAVVERSMSDRLLAGASLYGAAGTSNLERNFSSCCQLRPNA